MQRKAKLRYVLTFVAVAGLATVASGAENWKAVGMVTGSQTGTYYQVGRDIQRVSADAGLKILVKESRGSLDNIERMNSRENAGFGIVQSDVLGFLSRHRNPRMKRIASRLRLVFPLYDEEVHILARKGIRVLSDLQGKRVNIGREGSGTWLTATNLFKLTNVRPAQELALEPKEALLKVLAGEIDAMFFVAGKPVNLFTSMQGMESNPKLAPLLGEVGFVSVTDSRVLQEYSPASLSGADYRWLRGEIDTVAIKSVLVSFDFSDSRKPYFRQRCAQLARLGRAVREALADLQSDDAHHGGHPKWKQVDLRSGLSLWKRDSCSAPKEASMQNVRGTGGTSETARLLRRCIMDNNCR